jgi:hypothetical protein
MRGRNAPPGRCARIFRHYAALPCREEPLKRVQALKNALQYTCPGVGFPQNVQSYGL